jgi:Phosphotriesterase family
MVKARTGCLINTHTEPSDYVVTNPGIEQLDLLESEGADPARILIGHAFVNPDIDQLTAICARGANLQIDHIGIPWRHSSADELDDLMAKHIAKVADRGYLTLRQGGAVRGGLLHSPVQVMEPDASSCFCTKPAGSLATRRRLLGWAADTSALVLPAHLSGHSALEVRRERARSPSAAGPFSRY